MATVRHDSFVPSVSQSMEQSGAGVIRQPTPHHYHQHLESGQLNHPVADGGLKMNGHFTTGMGQMEPPQYHQNRNLTEPPMQSNYLPQSPQAARVRFPQGPTGHASQSCVGTSDRGSPFHHYQKLPQNHSHPQPMPQQTTPSLFAPPPQTQTPQSQGQGIHAGPHLPAPQISPGMIRPPPQMMPHGVPPGPMPLPQRTTAGGISHGSMVPPPQPMQHRIHPGSMPPPPPTQHGALDVKPGAGVAPSYPGHHNFPFPASTHGMNNFAIDDASRPIDILQEKCILPPRKQELQALRFDHAPGQRGLIPPKRKNCSPEVFRCTMNAFPCSQALLNKVKLPLGLIIHPFKDLSSLPVISAGTIVRCKRCRTYINPFVDFLDERRWRCNLCFVVNDVPEEFLHHPVTKSYGEPHTRPECTNATLEFIAPQEYMVRPPQPAVYMFLLDVSHSAIETGYLRIACESLLEHIDHLPGDSRTRVGFLTYNGTVHFYRIVEGSSSPQMLVISDIDDIFLPTPDSLLVNLRECKELVCDLLRQLPELHLPSDSRFFGEVESQSALGAALQVAEKLMSPFGGRVTVFQQSLPLVGPGALKMRENLNSRTGDSTESLNPSTDFYKKLALEFSAHQIAVDFFFMNSQYIDIATLSCSSRFSAGDLHYYPGLHVVHNPLQAERLQRDLDRYLTRKIGFEAVMRIRCTRGVAIHTFHGNFFVRSTDLLALANINPDAGFGLNLSIEESLAEMSSVCVQAALLYTSSRGERRIRVHTMCFPVTKNVGEIFKTVDSDAVVSLLSKMAVDRSIIASIGDAKDALLNAVIDPLRVYKETVASASADSVLLVPPSMRTFPLMMSCLFKHHAFRTGVSTRLDDRVFAMIDLKMQPAAYALQSVHPDLYRVDDLALEGGLDVDERIIPQPEVLPLTAASICRGGVYLLDTGWQMYLYVTVHTNQDFLSDVIGVQQFSQIQDPMYSLPDLDNPKAEVFHNFVEWLQDQRPHHAPVQVIREDSRERHTFMMCMKEDKTESQMSLHEFLQHIKQQMSK